MIICGVFYLKNLKINVKINEIIKQVTIGK